MTGLSGICPEIYTTILAGQIVLHVVRHSDACSPFSPLTLVPQTCVGVCFYFGLYSNFGSAVALTAAVLAFAVLDAADLT